MCAFGRTHCAILQSSVFGAALRDFTSISKDAGQQIACLVQGGLAVLALPDMDPPQLNAVLRTLERTVLGGAKNKGGDGDTRKGEKRGPGGPREEGEEHAADSAARAQGRWRAGGGNCSLSTGCATCRSCRRWER